MNTEKKTFVVTGGAGFLGSHLCKYLISKGNYVICIDNLVTGKKEKIAELMENNRFSFVEHDVIFDYEFDQEINGIFNFASPASPPRYQKDPIHTIKTNFLGTDNALRLATKLRIPMVQASTSEIYGDPMISPQSENYWGNVNPIGYRSCYDEGKRAAETLCFDYKRQLDTDVRVIRIFNTYGPGMNPDDGRVISNLIIQALLNEPMTVFGDGNQTRSFCFVDDLILGIIRTMEQSKKIDTPINLGNPTEFTINRLVELVKNLTKSNSEIIKLKLPEDDPKQRKPDITLAQQILKWNPVINLEEGLERSISYFRNLLEISAN